MRTIRRIYLYVVTIISIEIVLWGLINLARSALDSGRVGGAVSQLAGALSLILVGIPVFLLHWWLIQRSIPEDPIERYAGTRAVFLYLIITITLIPAAQNVLAIISRIFTLIFGLDPALASIGGGQSWLDNAIGLVMNLIVAAYFYSILRANWREPPDGEAFPNIRRVNRYFWVMYSLILLVIGVQRVALVTFNAFSDSTLNRSNLLAEGLAFIVFGAPLWVGIWRWVQRSLREPGEREATFRVVVLYALSLFGVGAVLIAAQTIVFEAIRALMSSNFSFGDWLGQSSDALSVALPLGGVWAYYGNILRSDREAVAHVPKRMGLRRLHYYILSAFGVGATLIAIDSLGGFLIGLLPGETAGIGFVPRDRLFSALATLIVGLPLWLRTWLPMAAEARGENEAGDHARRSIIRKSYLYLVLFVGVVGIMVGAGGMFFELFQALLGAPAADFQFEVLQQLKSLLLFGVLFLYHWRALRADSSRVQQVLDELHGRFSVLVLEPEGSAFAEEITASLEEEAPSIPVAVHAASQGAPGETLSEAKAVVLPAGLATAPSEALRLWLQAFDGVKLVVPEPAEGWIWVAANGGRAKTWGTQTAQLVRQLAEGEDPQVSSRLPAWLILLAVVGGMVGLIMLIGLIGELVSL